MPWLFLPVDQILAHGVADRFVVGIGTLASGAFHLEVEHVHGIADRHIPRVPVKHAFGMVVPGWHGRRLDFQRFKARRAATDAQSQAAPGVLLRLTGLDKLTVDEALDQPAQHEHLQLHRLGWRHRAGARMLESRAGDGQDAALGSKTDTVRVAALLLAQRQDQFTGGIQPHHGLE